MDIIKYTLSPLPLPCPCYEYELKFVQNLLRPITFDKDSCGTGGECFIHVLLSNLIVSLKNCFDVVCEGPLSAVQRW